MAVDSSLILWSDSLQVYEHASCIIKMYIFYRYFYIIVILELLLQTIVYKHRKLLNVTYFKLSVCNNLILNHTWFTDLNKSLALRYLYKTITPWIHTPHREYTFPNDQKHENLENSVSFYLPTYLRLLFVIFTISGLG